MITLQHMLTLSGILFALSIAGIFLNRKNVILLLMCIELMLLAVNFSFVSFSRFLGDLDGQVFDFFGYGSPSAPLSRSTKPALHLVEKEKHITLIT